MLLEKARTRFERAMDDDLDTPQAMNALFATIPVFEKILDGKMPVTKKTARMVCDFLLGIDRVLGVGIGSPQEYAWENFPPVIAGNIPRTCGFSGL